MKNLKLEEQRSFSKSKMSQTRPLSPNALSSIDSIDHHEDYSLRGIHNEGNNYSDNRLS